ncbi:MAG: hypothetical protein WAU70_14295 [Flavobacteriales bacterium]
MLATSIMAQPANDECNNAQLILVWQVGQCPAQGTAGNNEDATHSGVPACGLGTASYKDIWYTFNSGANTEITMDVVFFTIDEWGIEVLDACNGTSLFCDSTSSNQYLVPVSTATDYLIRFFTNSSFAGGGLFTLCLSGPGTVPVCDAGDITTDQGLSSVNVCTDGVPDVIGFNSTSSSSENYTLVLTHLGGRILYAFVDPIDFDTVPVDSYTIYGVSFNGALGPVVPGDDVYALTSTGSCIEVSTIGAVVNVDNCAGVSGIANANEGVWSVQPTTPGGYPALISPIDVPEARVSILDPSGREVCYTSRSFSKGEPTDLQCEVHPARGVYAIAVQWPTGREVLRVMIR